MTTHNPNDIHLTPGTNPLPQLPAEADAPPQRTLAQLRAKMEQVAREYADGAISRAQFNAIYAHYNEQRTLVEMLLARNPENNAWQRAATPGKTTFLREFYSAQPQNYVIYLRDNMRPLMGGGKTKPDMQRIGQLLRTVRKAQTRRTGVARLALQNPYWLVLAVGESSVTFVTFKFDPSREQIERVYDLQKDFERANGTLLADPNVTREALVFPQRALLERMV